MAEPRSALYREAILDHGRNPRNAGTLGHPDWSGSAANPLCGDELRLTLNVAQGRITDIRVAVRGCMISQAAASLMTLAVQGRTLQEAQALGQLFQSALQDGAELPPALESLLPLLEVKAHRSRVGCALLPWQALRDVREGG